MRAKRAEAKIEDLINETALKMSDELDELVAKTMKELGIDVPENPTREQLLDIRDKLAERGIIVKVVSEFNEASQEGEHFKATLKVKVTVEYVAGEIEAEMEE